MPIPHADRAILVTGCSSGIGKACALGLHAAGYRVFASVRNPTDAQPLEAVGIETVLLDLSDSNSIKKAVNHILERTDGKLYGLFNNASYGQPGAVEDITRNMLRAQFETNLFGTHELTCALMPTFRKQGYGRIIQNSSILGVISMAYRGAYNSSKYALEGLTDTLRLELADMPIYVSLIEPGPIASEFRSTAYEKFLAGIDVKNSHHAKVYQRLVQRFKREKDPMFTLPPSAILKPLLHALEAKRPKIRYPVTIPSHLFQILKRWLPHRWLDKLLLRIDRADLEGTAL